MISALQAYSTKRGLLAEGKGIPLGLVISGAKRTDMKQQQPTGQGGTPMTHRCASSGRCANADTYTSTTLPHAVQVHTARGVPGP